MSKRNLKKYLSELKKKQLEEQIIELYDKFANVKVFYDFVFNPNEEKLCKEAKLKISNEYFPVNRRKPKLRRSVAQKIIKHFTELGVDPFIIADVMIFSIEIAQTYTNEKTVKPEAFYKSILSLYKKTLDFVVEKGIYYDFNERLIAITKEALRQNWMNNSEFSSVLERTEY